MFRDKFAYLQAQILNNVVNLLLNFSKVFFLLKTEFFFKLEFDNLDKK